MLMMDIGQLNNFVKFQFVEHMKLSVCQRDKFQYVEQLDKLEFVKQNDKYLYVEQITRIK